jgi:hypothetical protein
MLGRAGVIPRLQGRLGRPANVARVGELDTGGSKNWPVTAKRLRCC